MKAAIIAAGKGSRLVMGGISIPKPLVPVSGEPMISRVIRSAARLKVTSIACIVNDLHPEVPEYLRANKWPVPVELLVKTTPNSMESLFALAPLLSEEPFILFTVDGIFSFTDLLKFYMEAQCFPDATGVLALTGYVDDEKPLWVRMDETRKIVALGDVAFPGPYVTAGFYIFHPSVFNRIPAAREGNLNALRQFLAHLVVRGDVLYGLPISKAVDVDHPEDIEKAETFLKEFSDIA